ncbi:amidohydrolase family protein [Cyclobacterium marinum]|uniref:amidohydrolase family protein n=1 Tax=Cyclobacterium marinum TaxID=104 RepID=UPI0011EBF28A|nr:amidohydrolase family protein [Cyclobacterium marinum]MBI0397438.1 amidohydrolase family protein [Cyclobacterium marinum]
MINKIDAHQHFWQYSKQRYAWIDDKMLQLKRDFLPDDIFPIIQRNSVEGTVAVQAVQDEKENFFLLELAEKHPFILAVIGWIDLKSPDLETTLESYKNYKKLKGFRHVLQDEADPNFILNQAFQNGLKSIFKAGFTYDLLVYPHQLDGAIQTVSNFEEGRFVLDHIAKPPIKAGLIKDWEVNIKALAERPNVYCKLSGMITEAAWEDWDEKEFYPYLDVIMKAFGEDRVMFGSDWPVCKLAGGYEQVIGLVEGYFKGCSPEVLEKIWRANAIKFYQL